MLEVNLWGVRRCGKKSLVSDMLKGLNEIIVVG